MIPYFLDADNWQAVSAIVDSWLGTPYRHLWMRKGRGADCCLFIGAILQELGIVSKVEFDFYPPDWYLHTKIEVVKNAFTNNIEKNMQPGFSLVQVSPTELIRGDIPSFSTIPTTGVSNHVGFMMDPPDKFVHSVQRRGVSFMPWGGYWLERTTAVYRVIYGS